MVPNSIPENGDSEPRLDPDFQMVLTPSGSVSPMNVSYSEKITSFFQQGDWAYTNNAGNLNGYCTIKKGVWIVSGYFEAAISLCAAAGQVASLDLRPSVSSGTVFGTLARLRSSTGIARNVDFHFKYQLTLNTDVFLHLQHPTVGVGEYTSGSWSILGNRIL